MTRAERTAVRRWLKDAQRDIEAARKTIALDVLRADPGTASPELVNVGFDLMIVEKTICTVRERIAP